MKILAVNKFYHVYGGADRYFFELGSILERNGHAVVPFSMQDSTNVASPYSEHFASHVDMFDAGVGERKAARRRSNSLLARGTQTSQAPCPRDTP